MTFTRLLFCLMLWPAVVTGEEVAQWTTNDGQLILQDVPQIPEGLVQRIRQYQNVRSAVLLDWTRDGDGIYLATRFGDLRQIHRVNKPGGARRQLTWFTEPAGQVIRNPKSRELAISMDQGGGEQDQLFLFDPRKAVSTLLTDGQSRNRRMSWSRDGRQLSYQSTRRNGRNNDLWIMDVDKPAEAELLLEAPDGTWWGPVDFSKNGKYLLVQQFLGVTDSRIYVLNLKDRSLDLVAGLPDRTSGNRALAFDRRGEGFYFITNERGQAAELAWKSLDPGSPTEYITAGIPWDVTDFALSENGRRASFVTNEAGVSRFYLLNTAKRSFSRVNKIPVGIISNMKFNPDNRRIAMTLSTAQTPNDVYVLTLARSRERARFLERWTFSEVGGLDTDSFVEPLLFQYPTFDLRGDEQRMVPAFIYRPASRGPHPVIIYIHGGPESQYRPDFSSTFQMWVAELGAAVIAPNIRGSTGFDNEYLALDDGDKREDAIRDVGALLDWIATQPNLDEQRVAVYGASYGGYVALASAAQYSDRLKAGVDVVGISNFVTFLENTEEYRRELRRREYGDERDPEIRSMLERISPINNVDRIDIPLLVVQGTNDPRVPARQSEQIVRALRSRGRPVWYIEALNEGHGYERKENRNVYEQAAVLFLQKFLNQ